MIRIVLSCLCLVGLVLNAALGQWDVCADVADGNLARINCTGYIRCKNHSVDEVLTCNNDTVLERDSLTCKHIGSGNTICGTSGTCNGTGYLPSPNCQSFFYCWNGTFYANGHIYCPLRLLFDGVRCNYPENVLKPCGMKEP
ncbi:hypothetical protein BsWGS_29127 [Bradybaena similaris]